MATVKMTIGNEKALKSVLKSQNQTHASVTRWTKSIDTVIKSFGELEKVDGSILNHDLKRKFRQLASNVL